VRFKTRRKLHHINHVYIITTSPLHTQNRITSSSIHRLIHTQPIIHHPSNNATSTSPRPNNTILAPLNHIPILDTHALDRSQRRLTLIIERDPRAAVPLPAVGLVVDLDHALAGGCADAALVEHHARHRVVVGEGVEDGARAEVPDLELC